MSDKCCGPSTKNPSIQTVIETGEPRLNSEITSFKVIGMDCADEVAAIQTYLRTPDIIKVDANLMTETVTIYHHKGITREKLHALIEKAGVKVVKETSQSFFQDHSSRMYLVGSSGLFLGIGLLLDWIEFSNQWVYFSFYLISMGLGGTLIFPKAWRSIIKLHLDMNVLMTVAVIGALFIKEYSEAASVVFLFSLAELLEALSVARARKAIREVLNVTPQEALVINQSGETIARAVNSLTVGEIVLVRAGDSVPVDGTISEGSSSLNQASLTGESRAVEKKVGDSVWGGTINESGTLKIRVDKAFQDTKISKIISLIEQAQSQKAPSQRFVDKFASIYTPSVLILALLVAIVPASMGYGSWDLWIYKALVLLVIGCPCALVIATPVSVVSGLTYLARRGVLVKGGVHLESLGRLKAMALDKTGTITNGTPVVTELKIFSNEKEEKIISLCASLESVSTHPLANAVMKYAKEKNVSFSHPKDSRIITGKGAEGLIDDHWYFVGNHALAHELGICNAEIEAYLDTVESKSMSVIVLGHKPHKDCKGEILAVFALGDSLRTNIKEAISNFHSVGVEFVAMLSGDNQKTVDAVSKLVGIDYAKGELLPDAKVEEVKAMMKKYHFVGMVGDGVNDGPALAQATLGIAMGVAGSDTAIETADVALMKDDLFELPKAIAHGKRVLNIIRFNIFFAIAIKAVFFVLAFLNLTNLWMAVAADMGASLLVTFNAMRLLRK